MFFKSFTTAIDEVLASENLETLKSLLDDGMDVHIKTRNNKGATFFLCAAKAKWWEAIELLIERGFDVNHLESRPKTEGKGKIIVAPLWGCMNMHAPEHIINLFLKKGANPLLPDTELNALTRATDNDQSQLACRLIEEFKFDIKTFNTLIPFCLWRIGNPEKCVVLNKMIEMYPGNLGELFYKQNLFSTLSAGFRGAMEKNPEQLRSLDCLEFLNQLEKRGVDLYQPAADGFEPFSHMACCMYTPMIDAFINKGVDPLKLDPNGYSALFHAVCKSHQFLPSINYFNTLGPTSVEWVEVMPNGSTPLGVAKKVSPVLWKEASERIKSEHEELILRRSLGHDTLAKTTPSKRL